MTTGRPLPSYEATSNATGPEPAPLDTSGGLVPVFCTVAVRTSAGPGPGVKLLPPAEAASLTARKLAVAGDQPPKGFPDEEAAMAVGRYVVTATTTVAAGAPAAVVAGEPGTGGAAGYGGAPTTGGPIWPVTYARNTVIMLDTASSLYTALSASLRPFLQGDERGPSGLAN